MMNPGFNESSTDSALKIFMSKDFRLWRGLNPGTRINDISRYFSVDETWSGTASLGDTERSFTWYLGKSDKFREDVRIWMGKRSAFLLDTRNPEIVQTIDDLVAIYGEPKVKFDAWVGSLFLKQSEWVFPERGVTVFLHPRHMKILRLAVYPAVDLDTYKSYLRLDLKITNNS